MFYKMGRRKNKTILSKRALVDNKEARCILKGYGENNLINRSIREK